MGEEGLPWLGCCGVPRFVLPALAYWYDGGRPSGCCDGFILPRELPSDVDDAVGCRVGGVLAFAVEFWEEVLFAAELAVPLTVGMEELEVGCESCEVEALVAVEDRSDVLRVLTSLRNRDDIRHHS